MLKIVLIRLTMHKSLAMSGEKIGNLICIIFLFHTIASFFSGLRAFDSCVLSRNVVDRKGAMKEEFTASLLPEGHERLRIALHENWSLPHGDLQMQESRRH